MTRFIKVGLVAIVVFVVFATYHHASAQQRAATAKTPEPVPALTPEPDAAATNHVLQRTYVNSAAPSFFTSVPAGTLSDCDPTAKKPSAWPKAVTEPEPLASGYAANPPSSP